MIRQELDRLRAHRANIQRYRRLLGTRLSELERKYIERRLNDEEASLKVLLRRTFPDRLPLRLPRQLSNPNLAALLNPAEAFCHPMDVVEDCDLTSYEKRAILSSWLADVCAVRGDGSSSERIGADFDDILGALQTLESGQPAQPRPDGGPFRPPGTHLSRSSFDGHDPFGTPEP
jgi:hypothetical protein